MSLLLEISKISKVRFSSSDPSEVRTTKDFLKKKNPLDYLPRGSTPKWDGFHRFYNVNNEFNLGLLPSLIKHLNEEDIEFDLIDNRLDIGVPDEKIVFSKNFISDERDYQRNAVKAILQNLNGIIIIPTRGGKTFTIAECMRILWDLYNKKGKKQFKALFVVDTDDLFSQALRDFSEVLNIPIEQIGVIKEQTFEPKNINIASIQTLESITRKTKKGKGLDFRKLRWRNFCQDLDFICVDEIQGYSNSNRLKILPTTPMFKVGVSATPWDNEYEAFKLLNWFGPLLLRVKERDLKDKGVLVKNFVFIINVSSVKNKPKIKGSGYRVEYNKKIVFNDDRNLVLADIAKELSSIGLKILVLSTRVYHGQLFYDLLKAESKKVSFISGESESEIRERETKKFLSANGGYILVATDIYKKGKTLPEAEVLINIAGQKKQSVTIQRRGRVLGTTKDGGKKFAIIIDVSDRTAGNIAEHGALRLATYKSLKEKRSIDDIFTFEANDFELIEKIKSKIHDIDKLC